MANLVIQYGQHTITVNSAGKFFCNGMAATSLASLQKKLDVEAAKTPISIPAIIRDSGRFEEVTVVGFTQLRRMRHGTTRPIVRCKNGKEQAVYGPLYAVNEANQKAVSQISKLRTQIDKLETRESELLESLEEIELPK